MLVHSTVTGQEITLTGIDIFMCVQFLITSAKYCLSYFLPPEKKMFILFICKWAYIAQNLLGPLIDIFVYQSCFVTV